MDEVKAVQTPWESREYYNPFFSDRNAMKQFVWQLENEDRNIETIERMVKRETLGNIQWQLTYFIWLQLTGKIKVQSSEGKANATE